MSDLPVCGNSHPYKTDHKLFDDKFKRASVSKAASVLLALPEPLKKLAAEKFAKRRRESALAAVDSYLDKAASALPVSNRVGVRSLQSRLSAGTPLITAVKEAFSLDEVKATDLAKKIVKAASQLKASFETINEGDKDEEESNRFSEMGFRTQTPSSFNGNATEGQSFLGKDR